MSETRIICGDARDVLATLPAASVHCVVTSPPYFGQRLYGGGEAEIGREDTPRAYVAALVAVFAEVWRVLRDDGTLWLNIDDSYANSSGLLDGYRRTSSGKLMPQQGRAPAVAGIRAKNLFGIPWRVAFALQDAGWWLRNDIIWHKTNAMPESVTDRCTRSQEYIFHFAKSERYYFDADAIREPHSGFRRSGPQAMRGQVEIRPRGNLHGVTEQSYHAGGRNKRTVWAVATHPFSESHFATFPERLVEPCILAGCPEGATVLDPFAGSGTTLLAAKRLGRKGLGIELNPDYCEMAERRVNSIPASLFAQTEAAV